MNNGTLNVGGNLTLSLSATLENNRVINVTDGVLNETLGRIGVPPSQLTNSVTITVTSTSTDANAVIQVEGAGSMLINDGTIILRLTFFGKAL